jgi:4-alpha-glucanotransferase
MPFIALAMSSVAKWCIIPIQDYLGLDNTCRTNKPSTLGCNWRWRARKALLSEQLQKEILTQTMRYGRMNWKNYKND